MSLKEVLAKYTVMASDEEVALDFVMDKFEILINNINDIDSTRMPKYAEAIQAATNIASSLGRSVAEYLEAASLSKMVSVVNYFIRSGYIPKTPDVKGPFQDEHSDISTTYITFDVLGEEITVRIEKCSSVRAMNTRWSIALRHGAPSPASFLVAHPVPRETVLRIQRHVRARPPAGFAFTRSQDPGNAQQEILWWMANQFTVFRK